MRYDYSGAIKGFVGKLDKEEIYEKKPFAFISYSHATEDVAKIYPFLKTLFEKGYLLVLDTEYAEMNDSWVNGMTKRVYDNNCKLMLTFISKSYMYSRPSLIEQYCRYSEECCKAHSGEVVPYMLVDTMGDVEPSYMDNPIESMIRRTQVKNSKEKYSLRDNSESAECLRDGLLGFYSSENDVAMSRRIINREYEALQKYENVDEIRRQMRFVLQTGDTYSEKCSIDVSSSIDKVIAQLKSCGIEADKEISEKAEKHFKEWGIEIYKYDSNEAAQIQYNPGEGMFQLIKADGTTKGKTSKDIIKITERALSKADDITNPEEHWICVKDGKSFRSKHGYFSDYPLTEEQENIHKRVVKKIENYMKVNYQDEKGMGHLIMIQGEAGTGKTVLVQRIFTDIIKKNPDGEYYFVVNHDELVSQYQAELKEYNISQSRVNKPIITLNHIEEIRKSQDDAVPDIIFVDEAHLMLTQMSQAYTNKNNEENKDNEENKNNKEKNTLKKYIKGDNMIADMRRNAKIVVLMFDKNQILQARQCWREDELEEIVDGTIKKGDFALLKRQMRITASQDVMKWIASFVGEEHKLLPIPEEDDYDFRIFNKVGDMYELIKGYAAEEENRDSRIVATFDWDYTQAHGFGVESKKNKNANPDDTEVLSKEEEKLKKQGSPWTMSLS